LPKEESSAPAGVNCAAMPLSDLSASNAPASLMLPFAVIVSD
jgi:hypothetical protein